MDNICRNIRNHHKFSYDFQAILTDLIYTRILAPSSKLSSYKYCHSLLEPPKYSLQDLYRALSVLAKESDFIQEELYKNSNFIHPRNSKILYYDCTNYYFEIEAEDGIKKYGKSNRFLNSFGNRSYVITFSLKKMKKEERDLALLPTQFKVPGSNKLIDLRTLDESDPEIYNNIYYKEYPLVTGDMDETVIITYSPKYKAYQSKIRNAQIDRAKKMLQSSDKNRKGKGPNDPARFIQRTAVTEDGEIAQKNIYQLDETKILEESMYDGFYAVVTNLEGDIRELIDINKQRWEIEENFRIMKSEFEARPVFVRREDRIKAHFLTCFISLLVYRLLEKKLGEEFTCSQILETLRNMNVTLLSKDSGYIPSYKRTKITDKLHSSFGFRTDYEFIRKSTMRTIIKETKQNN